MICLLLLRLWFCAVFKANSTHIDEVLICKTSLIVAEVFHKLILLSHDLLQFLLRLAFCEPLYELNLHLLNLSLHGDSLQQLVLLFDPINCLLINDCTLERLPHLHEGHLVVYIQALVQLSVIVLQVFIEDINLIRFNLLQRASDLEVAVPVNAEEQARVVVVHLGAYNTRVTLLFPFCIPFFQSCKLLLITFWLEDNVGTLRTLAEVLDVLVNVFHLLFNLLEHVDTEK